jgi:hypothetical protein
MVSNQNTAHNLLKTFIAVNDAKKVIINELKLLRNNIN